MDLQLTPTILLLDLPTSALGGIDFLSFATSPRFQGIKNVPQGWHFVFMSTTTSLSVRHGAWFSVNSSQPELIVKKWESHHESLVPETDQAEVRRRLSNLGRIWEDHLTPYRQSVSNSSSESNLLREAGSDLWAILTSQITAPLLTRIIGGPGCVTAATEINHWSLTSASSDLCDLDDIPNLSCPPQPCAARYHDDSIQPPLSDAAGSIPIRTSMNLQDANLNFLPIDLKRTWHASATGRARTLAARDRSWTLQSLVTNCTISCLPVEILGELQFCFVMAVTLCNHSSFEQWKRLVELLLTCREAVAKIPGFFADVIECLRGQLECARVAVEGMGLFGFLEKEWLVGLLKIFKRMLKEKVVESDDVPVDDVVPVELCSFGAEFSSTKEKCTQLESVYEKFEKLESLLERDLGWCLDEVALKRGVLELEDGERIEMDLPGSDEEDEGGEYAPVVVQLTTELSDIQESCLEKESH